MGGGETSTPAKTSKTPTPSKEIKAPPNTAPKTYPEWVAAFQAYYGSGTPPPGYFPATAPQPNPYIWLAQPLIPPYGTPPPPYATMYPYGGVYAQPSMAKASSEGEGKEQSPPKISKKSLGKAVDAPGSDANHSGDSGSGSEGSSEVSEGDPQDGEHRKRSLDEAPPDAMVTITNGKEHALAAVPIAMAGKESIPNLNIGMEYWPSPVLGPSQLWIQDERESKRQKRKQSNRESARRSRLRKQAEYEKLSMTMETLRAENVDLQAELSRLSEECKKFSSDNKSLLEQLSLCRDKDAQIVAVEESNSVHTPQTEEGASHSLQEENKVSF